MKTLLRGVAAILVTFFVPIFAAGQDATVTLILKSGEEIECRVADIWKGDIYFEATSPAATYRFGDRVSLDNVAKVRLQDGRTLGPAEFIDYRKGRQSVAPEPQPAAKQKTPTLRKVDAEPGMRLTPTVLQTSTQKSASRIGLRMPEAPRSSGQQIDLELSQLADLLAELGLGGRVLYETSQGTLAKRKLSESQQRLVEAIKQSTMWQRRRTELRDAHQQAFVAFNAQYGRDTDFVRTQFDFEPRSGSTAFLEFVQYLHVTAAAHVESEWQKVEQFLGRRGSAALLDVLNNYDDWYYLLGYELDNR